MGGVGNNHGQVLSYVRLRINKAADQKKETIP